uniref:Heme oxygenase n=1 Tax=uncultured bacterium A1Q1_fos_1231 TaxID=1256544 RepID=L7VUT8_9BACT|nr:heme oxygenase [uncultured bacterium A1Q1_fos_1231]
MSLRTKESDPISRWESIPPLLTTKHKSSQPLSLQLREGTKDAHRWVERLAFVRSFLRGVIDPRSYQCLLRDLHTVYGALEEGLRRHAHHPVLGWSAWPLLWRQNALSEDLDYLAMRLPTSGLRDLPWQKQPPSSAALRYAARIFAQADHSPTLLLAHAYTRYLGDLSGGQILRRIVGFSLGLPGPDGLRFYDFSQIPNHGQFKQDFRSWLDRLPLSVTEQHAVVQEAIAAFAANGALFEELAPRAGS